MKSLDKWRDAGHEPELKVYMIDPHNLEVNRGQLIGVTKCTLTDGYYSDTKISGSLETIGDNYIGGSWLRIMIDGEEVATLGVQNLSDEQAPEGGVKRTYALQSVLWMLDADLAFSLYTIAKNTKAKTALAAIGKTCGKNVIFQGGSHDSLYTAAKVYERTDSYRAIMADICSKSGNELSVDGHGRLSVSGYVAPDKKEVSWELVPDDPRGVVLSPGYTDADATGEAYNRTIVVAANSKSDGQPIVAHSDAPASSPISSAYRGWTRAVIHDVSDMSPFNLSRANQLVNQYIADDRSLGITRTCKCMYFPIKSGEIVAWVENGKKAKYLTQTIEADLAAWTVSLTLKKI
jgi:hypothetical protein